jgi:hypothetical protein
MRSSSATVALLCLAISLAVMGASSLPTQPTLTVAEQDVLEATLSSTSHRVIRETTSVAWIDSGDTYEAYCGRLRELAKDRDKAFQAAMEDYFRKNKTAVQLVFPRTAPATWQIVPDSALNEIFRRPRGWEEFHRRFPAKGGVTTISRVGIDSSGTVAVVYVISAVGNLGGGANIRILRRVAGRWAVQRDEQIGSGVVF